MYSYAAINDGDPFDGDGSLWNFNYFFLQQETETDFVLFVPKVKSRETEAFTRAKTTMTIDDDEHVGVRMRSSQMTPTPPLHYSSGGYAASFDDLDDMDDME